MPAEFDTGFVVRHPAWHGLAKVLNDYPGTWSEAAVLAGLDWDPEERPVYDVVDLYPDGRATVKAIEGFKQVVRSDNGFRLAIPNETYTLTPNSVMGEIIEAMLEQGQAVRYECAGSLYEGKRTFALLKLGPARELPGDPSPIQPYLALLNSHDGSAALRVIATSIRIVCANAWHAAEMDAARTGYAYTFRHTKNWRVNVEAAKQALSSTTAEIDKTFQRAEELLRVQATAKMREEFIREFAIKRVIRNTLGKMPVSKRNLDIEARMEQPKVKAALAATIDGVQARLASPSCDGIRDNLYGLVQAAGEFLDHDRPYNSPDSYLSRTMFNVEPGKQDAYRLAQQLATA